MKLYLVLVLVSYPCSTYLRTFHYILSLVHSVIPRIDKWKTSNNKQNANCKWNDMKKENPWKLNVHLLPLLAHILTSWHILFRCIWKFYFSNSIWWMIKSGKWFNCSQTSQGCLFEKWGWIASCIAAVSLVGFSHVPKSLNNPLASVPYNTIPREIMSYLWLALLDNIRYDTDGNGIPFELHSAGAYCQL